MCVLQDGLFTLTFSLQMKISSPANEWQLKMIDLSGLDSVSKIYLELEAEPTAAALIKGVSIHGCLPEGA